MLLHLASVAQDSLKNEKVLNDYFHSLAFEEFTFEAPGNDFEKMKDLSGYIRTGDKAAIKFLSIPGKPADFKKELIKEFIANKVSLFDSITIKTSDGEAFAWWQEEIPPAGSGYPVYLSFSIVMPAYQHITLLFVGTYPKKEHEDLKNRYTKSAFSIKTIPK